MIIDDNWWSLMIIDDHWWSLMGLIFSRCFEFGSRRFSCGICFLWFDWLAVYLSLFAPGFLVGELPEFELGQSSFLLLKRPSAHSLSLSLSLSRSLHMASSSLLFRFCWQNPYCLPVFLAKPSFPSKSPIFLTKTSVPHCSTNKMSPKKTWTHLSDLTHLLVNLITFFLSKIA